MSNKKTNLEKLNKDNPAKTKLANIKNNQKADCLAKIETNKLQQEHYKVLDNTQQKSAMQLYDYYQQRIDQLAASYTKQGYNKNQAVNIANKIINFEIANNTHPSMTNLKFMEAESKTFNLDKTIISNMGINEKDSANLLSKIESIEAQKLNTKEKMELGFRTYPQPIQDQQSTNKSKDIAQDKSQEINKNIDSSIGM